MKVSIALIAAGLSMFGLAIVLRQRVEPLLLGLPGICLASHDWERLHPELVERFGGVRVPPWAGLLILFGMLAAFLAYAGDQWAIHR